MTMVAVHEGGAAGAGSARVKQAGSTVLERIGQAEPDWLRHAIDLQREVIAVASDRDRVLRVIADRTPALFPAGDGLAVELMDGDELVYTAASGTLTTFVGLRIAVATSLSGYTVRTAEPAYCDDTATDARVDRAACARAGIGSMIIAPIFSGGHPIGALKISSRRAGAFTDTEASQLELLAGSLGSALRHAEDYAVNADLLAACTAALARAEEVNSELEAFSYSVSHDLRTPLRAIAGYAALLTDEFGADLPETAGAYLARIRTRTHDLAELLDALLTLARIQRCELVPAPVDMTALVHDAWSDLVPQQPLPAPQLTVDVLPGCLGDRHLLRDVWLNLLENAVKYGPPPPVPARICVGAQLLDGEDVYTVRDNGIGFDMRYQDQVFQAFERLHAPGQFTGTGVGLAQVRRIVARHHGRVWAHSTPGRGSTFFFTVGRPDAPGDRPAG